MLETENGRLKTLRANAMLDAVILQTRAGKEMATLRLPGSRNTLTLVPTPRSMVDKAAVLPASPKAQQQQDEMTNGTLAACPFSEKHLGEAARLSNVGEADHRPLQNAFLE